MAKEFRCRDCGEGPFSNPHAVHNHKVEKHGAPPRRAYGTGKVSAKKRLAKVESDYLAEVRAEHELHQAVVAIFENAGTTREADARVLQRLTERYGPEAYAEDE